MAAKPKTPAFGAGLQVLFDRAAQTVREQVGILPNPLSARSRALRSRNADAKATPGICPYCAVGCATLVYHRGNTIVDIEGNPASPINGGTLCAKGAATYQLHVNPERWTTCKYRAPGATEWQEVSLEWAMASIARRVRETREATFQEVDERGRRVNRTMAIASLGGATLDNEENYLIAKLFRSLGVPFVENQARMSHSSTVPGLGTSFGRGGAATFLMDLQHADLIVIQGSNFAESHPVGFRFVTAAQAKGAMVVHVDPRFTRTSALADLHVPLRSGTDIAFLGGLINYVLEHERYFKEYVLRYTNAAFVVNDEYRDSEDLEGIFSGLDPEKGTYDLSTWGYEVGSGGEHEPARPKRDDTLRHPRCVLNLVRRHYRRYTPEMVERICGTPQEQFLRVAELLCENSGRERTAVFCYAMGWTQHTVGVQNVRAGGILQSLLGNIGRPGGGILALGDHASIQGSTDNATLYDLLPGYLEAPSLERGDVDFATWCRNNTPRTGWWNNFPKYAVSFMKAWYGQAATRENDWAFDYLPKNTGDHSHLPMFVAMKDGTVRGLFLFGQNPAVGGPNAEFQRNAMAKLDWLVVRDNFETESAAFWKRPGVDPKQIPTEVFFIPAAAIAEKAGTLTNTMRLVQFHEKAVDPPDECRSDLGFVYQLGKRLKGLYAESSARRDRPILDMTWDYEHHDARERRLGEPDVEAVMREMNGYDVAARTQLAGFAQCCDDGSTACGCWIYAGMYPGAGENLTRRRRGDDWVSPEWAWAWPANRRLLYNRASADPAGKPWSERKKYVWWDAERGAWTGYDVPDFPADKAPTTPAEPGGFGIDAHDGASPFIMNADGVAQLFAATGACDAPLPTHYEPRESPVPNALYPKAQVNPVLKEWCRRDNPYHEVGDPRYPYVITTYRLTEHQTAGAMTRWLPWLAELQPELFCEISPELAVERGIRNGAWMTIETARGEVEAKALVTGRMQPLRLGEGRYVHQIGLPWHFGFQGVATGDTPNILPPLVADPNVSIHEGKAFTCNVRPGRRNAAHAYAADDDVPQGQRNPMGSPSRPGAVAATSAESTQAGVVPPAVVTAAARLAASRAEEGP